MALSLRHLIPLVLVLLPWTGASLSAQNGAKPPPPPPQFRIVSMADTATFLFDVENKQETLYATAGAFSRLYPSPPTRELVFYKQEPNPDPRLPALKVPLARAIIPAGPGPFLVLLASAGPGAPLPFQTRVIDHSLAQHPPGTYRVFNFSRRRLAVNLADVKFILARGQEERAPYPPTRKAWLQVAADEGRNGWLPVSGSPHVVGAATDSRTTVFLVDIPPSELDPAPKGIVVRRIRESITTDEAGVRHVR